MKKPILAIFLIMAVCALVSLAQTKRDREGGRMTKNPPRINQKIRKKKRKVIRKKIIRKKIVKKMEETKNSDALTTESGLTYIITKRGDGVQVKAGDNVIVNYTGLLTNGQKFDSSLDRGETLSFQVGAGRVIKGWDEGLQKLRVGDHATFIIPSSIAYGERGAGGIIPPNATLIFIIEVVGIK